jgi:hypothetical protein
VIAEEQRIYDMMDEADTRTRLDVRAADLGDLSADQARAVTNIGASPYLVQPLQAPAGAGKTHSLKALRAAAHRANKDVLVLPPTGKAVDEAMRDEAGDRGLTVAKALSLIELNELDVDWRTLVVVDDTKASPCSPDGWRWRDRPYRASGRSAAAPPAAAREILGVIASRIVDLRDG